jgi:serine/threonine protein kinase
MNNVTINQTEVKKLERIGDFEILGKLDQGGIAEIYLGRQKSLDRMVAVKILSPDHAIDPDMVRRFEDESKIIARLRHPHIVHVIDRGIDNGRYYFVMDLIEGITFKKMIEDNDTTLVRKLSVIIQALKALDYAHKNGVIHRDIKPANILIDKDGNALVVDFGIAQILDKDDLEHTQPDVIMGSLMYMSPEQKISSVNIDHTTDIFAVGVILYEILTGEIPQGKFPSPSSLNNTLNPELDKIVLKCLERNPRDRYQSVSRLKDDLLSTLHRKNNGHKEQKSVGGELKDYIGRLSFLDTLSKTKTTQTHLVEDRADGAMYVLKTLIKSDKGIKEAMLLKTLDRSGFVKILAAGSNSEKSVILMQYVRGGSLEDRLVRVYPPRVALTIFRQIAEVLDRAHKNNLVHGDLRPGNILFDEADNVILTDFGQAANHRLDKQNHYSAPEKKKTNHSDIYSAGVILHRLLTNTLPIFDSYLRLIWQDSYPKLPVSLKLLMMRMLRNGNQDRPQSFGEVLEEIDKCETELADSGYDEMPAEDSSRKRKLYRPKFVLIMLIILFLGVLLLEYGETVISFFFGLTSH